LKRQPVICVSYGSKIGLSNSIFLLTMNTSKRKSKIGNKKGDSMESRN
jgi:hypothetical protein